MSEALKIALEGALDVINHRLTEKLAYQAESHHVINTARAEGACNELMELKHLILNELDNLNPVNPDQQELTHYFQYKNKDYGFVTENKSKILWKHEDHYIITRNSDKHASVAFSGNYEAALTWLDK